MSKETQEQLRMIQRQNVDRREKIEQKTPERARRTPEERKKVIDKKRATIQSLMQGQFPGERGHPGFDRTVRAFIKTHKETLKKAGIHGTKEQQERQVRQIMFGDAMNRLTTREQQMIRGVSDAYKIDGHLLATMRDLGVDGFGYSYDGMKRKDVWRQMLEVETVAKNVQWLEKDLAAILVQDISPKEKRKAIERLVREKTKKDSLLDGIEDELEMPNRAEAQLQRVPNVPRWIVRGVQRGYQNNQKKERTYGYSRSTPSKKSEGSSPSQPEIVSSESLKSINAEGKGKRVIDTINTALQTESVRGKHCWDWCEKIYNRAGVGRKNLYSNFKTGRNDRNTGFNSKAELDAKLGWLKPGDWLFVKNHNSSDTWWNHSVIFLGWEGNKVRTANCPRPGSPGRISSYDVADCPIVWVSRAT